jgi:hypothetical protein
MQITAAGRAHAIKRIDQAATVADLEDFWNNRIGIPLKGDQEIVMAFYQRFKALMKSKR